MPKRWILPKRLRWIGGFRDSYWFSDLYDVTRGKLRPYRRLPPTGVRPTITAPPFVAMACNGTHLDFTTLTY